VTAEQATSQQEPLSAPSQRDDLQRLETFVPVVHCLPLEREAAFPERVPEDVYCRWPHPVQPPEVCLLDARELLETHDAGASERPPRWCGQLRKISVTLGSHRPSRSRSQPDALPLVVRHPGDAQLIARTAPLEKRSPVEAHAAVAWLDHQQR
jgi:hypothetical protein